MEMDFIQITQDDIDQQAKTHEECYLSGAKVGDWVLDDNELLASQSCVYDWVSKSKGKEQDIYNEIYEQLTKLNSK